MSEKRQRVLGPGARGDIDHPELMPGDNAPAPTATAQTPPGTPPQPPADTKENNDGPTDH